MDKFVCRNCGKEFKVYRRDAPNGRSFCSTECSRIWQSQFYENKRPTNSKKCLGCNKYFEKSSFKVKSYCPKCFSEYTVKRYNAKKLAIIELLGGKCCECNESVHPAAFSLHHLSSETKKFDWGKLKIQSMKTVADEIKKCVLMCTNCHSKLHSGNHWNDLEDMKEKFLKQLKELI